MKSFRKGAKKVGKLQFFKKRNKNQKQSVECWNGVKKSAEETKFARDEVRG